MLAAFFENDNTRNPPVSWVPPSVPVTRNHVPGEIAAVFDRYGLDPDLPLITQVSRFDRSTREGFGFLVTRHLREYLTLMFAAMHPGTDRIEL